MVEKYKNIVQQIPHRRKRKTGDIKELTQQLYNAVKILVAITMLENVLLTLKWHTDEEIHGISVPYNIQTLYNTVIKWRKFTSLLKINIVKESFHTFDPISAHLTFDGATADCVWFTISPSPNRLSSVLLLGLNPNVSVPSISTAMSWQTPFSQLRNEQQLLVEH